MKRKRLLLTAAFCLWFLAAAAACSHYRTATSLRTGNLRVYDGPVREKSDVGYLACGASDLEIAGIDGRPIKAIQENAGFEGAYSYLELLPGHHSVRVKGRTFDTTQRRFHTDFTIDIASYTRATTGESTLKFTVEAGHVYLIDSEIEKADKVADAGSASHIFRIFIKDAQTKRIIAEDKREIVRRSAP